MIIVRQIIQYHKWRTFDRLAMDLTITSGQIVKYFVNRPPQSASFWRIHGIRNAFQC